MCKKCRYLVRFYAVVLITLFIFLLFGGYTAFAIEADKVHSEAKGEWQSIDERIEYSIDADGFNGFLKQYIDEKNGCFYVYFCFNDKRLIDSSDEAVVLSFVVENDESIFRFSVNKDGFINTAQDSIDAIELAYNFGNCSCAGEGGEVFVGFELKDKNARKLKNAVSCIYSGGVNTVSELFSGAVLDMYEEPTTTKSTKSEKTTTKASESSKNKTVKSDNDKTVTKRSSGNFSGDEKTTKYSGSGSIDDLQSDAKEAAPQTEEGNTAQAALKRSPLSVGILAASAVIAAVGIIIITVCATDSIIAKKKAKSNDNNDSE